MSRSIVSIIFFFSLAKHGLTPNNLFEEVPVIIKNSNLASILLCEIEDISNIKDKDSFLSLATGFVSILVNLNIFNTAGFCLTQGMRL